ncbi:DUF924 family protein [Frigidibacter sp.]|uniref:DUF924 family protein n=1 Tax=Frigidibacter sp. TaxID=2586418 RepID=UPI002734AED4|nr:DUF924 family protein [Frigidibacter sp.]MDP3340917.1 DUF924 family protein [Frigidibacter sp.]
MASTQDILAYWAGIGPAGWYAVEPAQDAQIRDAFLPDWEAALAGEREHWIEGAEGSLGYIILTDQFPRNMFRGDARSFATDAQALAAARVATDAGWDSAVAEPLRQFFYLPFMHSEALADQARCQQLVVDRMPETGAGTLQHARAHALVILRFGRFPYRNAALGRETTEAEAAFIAEGGYGAALREVQAADGA